MPEVQQLSRREREVATLAARGETDKTIAAALRISPHTVNIYWRKIFLKLATRTRTEAIARLCLQPEDKRQLSLF